MKESIVLIGMPGAGKSTVGVVLAKAAGYDFVDADLVIQSREHKKLCELIAERGTKGFLELENRMNCRIDDRRAVIATGGSAVYGTEAMEHYKEFATIVYLSIPYEELESRLGDLQNRGVVLEEKQTLYGLYQTRSALYEKYADITIAEAGLDIRETVMLLLEKLELGDRK